MSNTAEAVLQQLRKLPMGEQQQILQELLRTVPITTVQNGKVFPTVRLGGGPITSEQVAEALEDE